MCATVVAQSMMVCVQFYQATEQKHLVPSTRAGRVSDPTRVGTEHEYPLSRTILHSPPPAGARTLPHHGGAFLPRAWPARGTRHRVNTRPPERLREPPRFCARFRAGQGLLDRQRGVVKGVGRSTAGSGAAPPLGPATAREDVGPPTTRLKRSPRRRLRITAARPRHNDGAERSPVGGGVAARPPAPRRAPRTATSGCEAVWRSTAAPRTATARSAPATVPDGLDRSRFELDVRRAGAVSSAYTWCSARGHNCHRAGAGRHGRPGSRAIGTWCSSRCPCPVFRQCCTPFRTSCCLAATPAT